MRHHWKAQEWSLISDYAVQYTVFSLSLQSYGTDEAFVTGGTGLGRLFSGRRHHASESSVQRQTSLQHQISVQRQTSVTADPKGKPDIKRQISEKQQEQWDKELPEVPLKRVIKLNAPEWWIILFGILGAMVNGVFYPTFSLLFGEILSVFALPADEVLDEIHLYAGLFIVLGFVAGCATFVKVNTADLLTHLL